MCQNIQIAAYTPPLTTACLQRPLWLCGYLLSQTQFREVCFIRQASEVSSSSNSTSLKVLWMSLNGSKDNQGFSFCIMCPSVSLSALIPLPHIHTSHLLILAWTSFPYGSFLTFLSWHLSVMWSSGTMFPFPKIPISACKCKPITMIIWLMSVFPLSFRFMKKGTTAIFTLFFSTIIS